MMTRPAPGAAQAAPRGGLQRTYVRREGRITPAQRRALETLWPRYGIAPDGPVLDLDAVFGRRAPRTLEIGFGNGEALAAMAAAQPERDFVGIEVYRPGVGSLLRRLAQDERTNVRVFCADAVAVLRERLPPAAFDRVCIFFPDPWPKKRHHKRRLIQPAFLDLLAGRMAPGGELLLATDWADYAAAMLAALEAHPAFRNRRPGGGFAPRPAARPPTRFERRGRRLGHAVWDLAFERVGGV